MTEFPAMPLYVRDWLGGEATRRMTPEQRSAFLDLLCHAWQNKKDPCTVPDDDDALASLSGLGAKRWKAAGAFVRQQFHASGEGRLRNAKQYEVYCEMQAHRENHSRAGHEGARRRWQGHADATPPPPSRHPAANGKSVASEWPASSSAVTTSSKAAAAVSSSAVQTREENAAAAAVASPSNFNGDDWAPRDRKSLQALHVAVHPSSWAAWQSQVDQYLATGATRLEIATAAEEFVANGEISRPKLSVFRGYVDRVRERFAKAFEDEQIEERKRRASDAPIKDPEPPPLTPEDVESTAKALRENLGEDAERRFRAQSSASQEEGPG